MPSNLAGRECPLNRDSQHLGVSSTVALREFVGTWTALAGVWLCSATSSQVEVRQVVRELRHLAGGCLSLLNRSQKGFCFDSGRSTQDGLLGGLFARTHEIGMAQTGGVRQDPRPFDISRLEHR